MKIHRITFESGNDFKAMLECEHCGTLQKLNSGYHDNFYHEQVIPKITCAGCGKRRDGTVPARENENGTVPVSLTDQSL